MSTVKFSVKKHKPRLNTQKTTPPKTGLYELVLVAVHMEDFQCTD